MMQNNSGTLVRGAAGCLLLLVVTSASAADFKPFTADSFSQIRSQYENEELLVGLWSVDCPPCLVELAFMGKLLKLNPDLPYVLVSTDPIEQKDYAQDFIEDFELDGVDAWMFADSFVEKLRFSIDPAWYGELPRSYFFDSENGMHAHSGIVDRELLEAWFDRPLKFP